MPIDPAAGFPTTSDDRLRARIAELERQAAANPGAQASGGVVATVLSVSTLAVNLAGVLAQNGPRATLTVPEPGAFVQFYAECDIRGVSTQAGLASDWWAGASVIDSVYLGGDGVDGVAGHEIRKIMLRGSAFPQPAAGAFDPGRQPGAPAVGINNNGIVAPGSLLTQWAKPGQRTFYLACYINGAGLVDNGGSVAEFRNRRLMARVLQ